MLVGLDFNVVRCMGNLSGQSRRGKKYEADIADNNK